MPEVVCLSQVIISHFGRPCAIILPRWLPLPSMTSRLQQKSFAESVISPLPLPPKDVATMHCRLREPAFVLYIELLQYLYLVVRPVFYLGPRPHLSASSSALLCAALYLLSFVVRIVRGSLGIRSSPYLAPRSLLCCHLTILLQAVKAYCRWQQCKYMLSMFGR